MNFRIIKKHFWLFGLTIGAISASIITIIITVWEWIENPSGIFHNQNGSNWSFVYDTAISWFVPTFINISIISAVAHLIFSLIKRIYKKDV